jgi:hypothetical protein
LSLRAALFHNRRMRSVFLRTAALILLPLLVVASALPACALDAAGRVNADVQRLQQAIQESKPTDPMPVAALKEADKAVGRARAALAAGRLYVGLEELGRARLFYGGAQVAQQPGAGFEAAWKRAQGDFTSGRAPAGPRASNAALEALAEVGQGKSLPLFQTSRAYAEVTNAGAGLYYLGQAKASADFAAFCRGVGAPRRGGPLALRSLAPELAALQAKVDAAFQPPRSIEQHPAFIALNATLKLAGELEAQRLYAGALYQYLDAVQQLATLDAGSTDAADPRAALAALAAQVKAARRDDSIAELFLERAQTFLDAGAPATGSAAPGADEVRKVVVIARDVLPAYFAWLRAAAPKPAPGAARAGVTITLVRWPYT